jgi:hypothetical protein
MEFNAPVCFNQSHQFKLILALCSYGALEHWLDQNQCKLLDQKSGQYLKVLGFQFDLGLLAKKNFYQKL